MRLLRFVFLCVIACGCTQKNPAFCDSSQDCNGRFCNVITHTCSEATDGPPRVICQGDRDCPRQMPHCLGQPPSGLCVECVTSMDCMGGRICDPTAHTCGPCTTDSDCAFAGGVCASGACPPANQIAWADCSATMCPGNGSRAQPFCRLSDAVGAQKPVVALVPGSCSYGPAQIQHDLELAGRGAKLNAPGSQDGLNIQTAKVTVTNLEVTSTDTMSGNGIEMGSNATLVLDHVIVDGIVNKSAFGIYANNGTMLTVERCLVYDNAGWGIQVQDTNYTIENSFIVANGSSMNTPNSGTGGVRILGQAQGLFVYNTVARNTFEIPIGMQPKGAGVKCDTPATLADSLLIENQLGLGMTADTQGMCTLAHSISTTDALPLNATQIFIDPSKPEETGIKGKGFHVQPSASTVVGKSSLWPAPAMQTDYDGDPRPAATTPGADEP